MALGKVEIPLGLGLITVTLFALCAINLFTKQVATLSGVAFTIIFFAVFAASESVTRRRGAAHAELDQFHLEYGQEINRESVGCRPGNILVPVKNYHTLYHLAAVLDRVKPERRDVVVLRVRQLRRAGSGEHALEPEQLFSALEQQLFTQALALAERRGKTIHLAVVAATDPWDGILRTAQSLESSTIVLGRSGKWTVAEQARQVGLAWERLPDPRPQFNLEIFREGGVREFFLLGPHAPHLTANEIKLIHQLWLRFSDQVAPEELHHHDVVHFALNEVRKELEEGNESEVLRRLKQHLEDNLARRRQ